MYLLERGPPYAYIALILVGLGTISCYHSNMVQYFFIEHGKNPIEHRKLYKYRKCSKLYIDSRPQQMDM